MSDIKEYLYSVIGYNEEADTAKDHLVKIENDGKYNINAKIRSLLTINSLKKLQMKLNPTLHSNYLLLDKNYANTVGDYTNKLSWLINTGSPVTKVGYVNCDFNLSDIVAVKLKKIVFTPVVAGLFDTILNTYSIGIDELSAQSFLTPNNIRFHFMMNYINGELSPFEFNRGLYNFNKPVKFLDSITISMYNPIYPIDIRNNSQVLYILLEIITNKVDDDDLDH
jgi:hypothetical protein